VLTILISSGFDFAMASLVNASRTSG